MEHPTSLARDMIAEAGRTGALRAVVAETWAALCQGVRLAWAVLTV